MASYRAVKDYLKEGGATNDKIDDFLDFCSMFSKGKNTAQYECCRFWARLLHHCQTPLKKNVGRNFGIFHTVVFTNVS